MSAPVELVDSHCHLDSEQFDTDRQQVIERALSAGVRLMLSIGAGAGPQDLEAAIRLAERFPCVWASVGVHPHDAAKADDGVIARLEALLKHPRVVAVGEIGLDYYYDFAPRERQRALFRDQLALARRAAKPVIIHTREAWEDTFAILEASGLGPAGGIMHCFSGGPEHAQRALDLGFHISFSGIVTFPKAAAVHAAARMVPDARLLVETDAPYLAPVPHRGKRNEPAFTVLTAQRLAELRGASLESIAAVTTANFRRLCLPAGQANG